jgi:multidrug efflux pump subunit AcrB
MNWYEIPVKRPVATSMFFCAILLLGIVGFLRIPVELIPDLEGDSLHISFTRPNSDPEIVEREILIPLEGKASELPGLKETYGEVNGSQGSLDLTFEPGTDIKIRQLELQRITIELSKEQPRGTFINVSVQNFSMASRIVMSIQVLGAEDTNTLRTFVEERVQPRIAAVKGVANVLVFGGAPEEITVIRINAPLLVFPLRAYHKPFPDRFKDLRSWEGWKTALNENLLFWMPVPGGNLNLVN